MGFPLGTGGRARPQDLPVIVIPGADHFFHRKLQHIKNLMVEMWHR